eukprot:TRINITY_DN7585_c0_g1_i1.p1 TRINITY_DN7585_c0_g1~~TRINITY_DN7585_c0_g1_i1.p1  ORF type:complete len:542 (-),score=92.46 TRINITY_DN7585_c0_g1_i1:43-1668(-)
MKLLWLCIVLCVIVVFAAPGGDRLHRKRESWRKFMSERSTAGGCPRKFPSVKIAPHALDAAIASFSTELESAFKNSSIPGLTAAVVYDQDILWSAAFGVTNTTSGEAMAVDSLFRIGSISKVFADLLLLQTRDAGRVDLDEPIVSYMDKFRMKSPYPTTRGITFRQLGSHTAGLPREAPCWSFSAPSTCNISNPQMLEELAQQSVILPPAILGSYSNLGFALLGNTLAHIEGERDYTEPFYELLVQKRILSSLGMRDTGFQFTADVRKRMSVGYATGYTGDHSKVQPAPLYDLGWTSPAGQMYSNVNDLAALAQLMFRDETPYKPSTNQILDGQTLREMIEPVYITSDDGATGFALPWELYRFDGVGWAATKGGDVPGFTTEMVMIPNIKLAVIVLHNYEPAQPGASPFDHAIMGVKAIAGPLLQLLTEAAPFPATPPDLSAYAGKYIGYPPANDTTDSQIDIELAVDPTSKQLTLTSGQLSIVLAYQSPGMFQTFAAETPPCMYFSGGQLLQWVYFDSPTAPASFSAPGFWPRWEFKRAP